MAGAEVVENILREALGDSIDELSKQAEHVPDLAKEMTKKLSKLGPKLNKTRDAVDDTKLVNPDSIAAFVGDDLADLLVIMEELADHPELLKMRGLLSCCVSQKNTVRDWKDLTNRTGKIKEDLGKAWSACEDVFTSVMDCVDVFSEENLRKEMKDFDRIPDHSKNTIRVFEKVFSGDIQDARDLEGVVGDLDEVISAWERLLDQLPVHKLSKKLRTLTEVFERAKGDFLDALKNALQEINRLFHDILQTVHQLMSTSPLLCCVNPPPALVKVQTQVKQLQAAVDVSAMVNGLDGLASSLKDTDPVVFSAMADTLDDFDATADQLLDGLDDTLEVLRGSIDTIHAAEGASSIYGIFTQFTSVFD